MQARPLKHFCKGRIGIAADIHALKTGNIDEADLSEDIDVADETENIDANTDKRLMMLARMNDI